MKKLQNGLRRGKSHTLINLATSLIATLAIAGSINCANATPIKTSNTREISSVSLPLAQTKPIIAQL